MHIQTCQHAIQPHSRQLCLAMQGAEDEAASNRPGLFTLTHESAEDLARACTNEDDQALPIRTGVLSKRIDGRVITWCGHLSLQCLLH